MGLFGGSKSKTPASGYYALPGDLKTQYTDFYNAIPGATAANNFVLPEFNADQQNAFSMARSAANPTAQSIQQLLAAYQNPFNESVINEINRQAQGPYSILKQALNNSGQLGSNRQMLGANDIDLSRQNQIGQFLQSQFNNSLNTGLQQQQQGFQNILGIGNQQQQQQYSNQLAPLQGLQAQAGLLNPVVDYFAKSYPEQVQKTGGGIGGFFGGLGSIGNLFSGAGGISSALGYGSTGSTLGGIGSALSAFSDRRLKENIKPVGQENGHNIYEFSYKDDPKGNRYIGVIADEVEKIDPDAVILDASGFYQVNYDKIGIKFREANGTD